MCPRKRDEMESYGGINIQPCEWGFDYTDFDTGNINEGKENFERLLKEFELDEHYVEKKGYYRFVWSKKDSSLKMVTGNNPLTGESGTLLDHTLGNWYKTQSRPGFLGFVGITCSVGNEDMLMGLVMKIRRYATYIKDESYGRRNFI